ncbi:hypothetical protein E4U55_006570 [Claviceps digitariae]|nr:hypothetical protein E4U55_006570 [Claviceps digitariae]
MTLAAPAPAPAPAPALNTPSSSGQAITAALTTIQNKTTDLGTAVSSWNGHLLTALPITLTATDLLTHLHHATSTAHASPPLTVDGALAVALATGSLSPVVQSTLRTIVRNKPRFDALLVLSPVVLLQLELQRRATADFSDAVVDKVPGNLKGVARGLIKPIDDAFGEAIEAYRLF